MAYQQNRLFMGIWIYFHIVKVVGQVHEFVDRRCEGGVVAEFVGAMPRGCSSPWEVTMRAQQGRGRQGDS
jgi:hypothetical protein